MVNWWINKGVTGFRLDAITFIKKDQDYSSVPVDGADGLGSIKYKTRNRPGIDIFLNELKAETFSRHSCVTVGEAPGVPEDQFPKYIGKNGFFDMIFDFHAIDIDVESGSDWFKQRNWSTADFKRKLFSTQIAFQNSGWGTTFIENHDQPRSITKLILDSTYHNDIGAKALANMYFFLRGTPFIYQGQEIGMLNFERESILEFDDVSSIDNYKRAMIEGYTASESLKFVNLRSRDNARTPMVWSSNINGGFNDGYEPWLKFNNKDFRVNVQSQLEDSKSTYSFYKELINIRNFRFPRELVFGKFDVIDSDDNVVAYKRSSDTCAIYSITNLSNVNQYMTLPKGDVLLNNYQTIEAEMLPYQTLLIRSDI